MYRQERKIPTLLALFILFAGLGGAVFGDSLYQSYQSKASAGPAPVDIHFSNITQQSFTVSWLTDSPVLGSISISGKGKTLTLVDDGDSDGITRPRTVHLVTAQNLTPDTAYEVKIVAAASCTDAKCPVLSQKTAAKEAKPTNLPPLRGTVQTKDGKPADGALIYVTVGKSLPLSARTDSAGLWVVQLTALRGQDLSDHVDLTDADIIQIAVKRASTETTTAVLDVKSLKGNVPLPPIQFGKSYNLIGLVSKRKDIIAQQANPQTLGVSADRVGTALTGSGLGIDLLFPKADYDTTTDPRPRFRGISLASSKIRISLDADAQAGTVAVGKDGTWNSRPTRALSPGTHRITVSGTDAQGQQVSLTRKFIVLKSGERVLGESTASASLTPTPTGLIGSTSPTPTPDSSLTVTPTMDPSLSVTPTITVAVSPSITPILTLAPTATPGAVPRSGSVTPTIVLLGGGAGLLGLAAVLLLLL